MTNDDLWYNPKHSRILKGLFMSEAKKAIIVLAIGLVLITAGCTPVMADEKDDSTQALLRREISKNKKTRIVGFPYAYYTPETELAVGVGGILTFYTGQELILRPSKITLSGYYSIRDQYKISLGTQAYFARNSTFLSVNLNYGQYADKFWGIGNNTPEIETEDYVSQAWGINVDFEFIPLLTFIKMDKSGIIYDYYLTNILDKKENPFLNSGDMQGSEGGVISGLGFILVKDSRDHIFFPNRGGFNRLKLIFYRKETGSDFDFNYYELDLRRYLAFKPDHVLATQVFANFVRGGPPFYKLPALGGGQIMRGYYQGRYRDRSHMAAQAEYRGYFWRRFGFAAFIGVGDVADGMEDFKIKYAKVSWGWGLRFKFNQAEKVNLRMDYGIGKNSNGLYFGLEEAF